MTRDALDAVWVDHVDDVPQELWDECFVAPNEGKWFYHALAQSGMQDQFTFRYLLLRRDGQFVGLAPVFLMDMPLRLVVPGPLRLWVDVLGRVVPWLRSQRTLFVGSPCAESGQIGLISGVDRVAAMRRIEAALREEMKATGASLRVWKDLGVDNARALTTVALETGLFPVVSFPTRQSPWLAAPRNSTCCRCGESSDTSSGRRCAWAKRRFDWTSSSSNTPIRRHCARCSPSSLRPTKGRQRNSSD